LAALAVSALIGLAFLLYEVALRIPPFDADNLVVLSTSARSYSDPWNLFTGSFISYIPGYRPLPYVTIWAQYRLFGVDATPFFVVNVLLWAGCAAVVYLLAARLAMRARGAVLLAAVALLVDTRGRASIYWIGERQATMACVLGGAALLLVLGRDPARRRRVTEVAIFALLLGAFLSKEYGLAFAPAMFAVAAARGRAGLDRRLLVITVGAVAAYGLMRLALAGGASPPYCEQMGFFGERRTEVCYDEVSFRFRVSQHVYNIGATLAGTLLPGLFEDDGVLRSPSVISNLPLGELVRKLALPGLVAVAAVVAWIRHTRATLPLLVLVVANATLSFMLYRDRNPLVGLIAVYASAGVTFAELLAGARASRARAVATAVAALAVLAVVGGAATLAGDPVEAFQAETASTDPCVAYSRYREEIAPGLLARVKREHGLHDVDCRPATPP
jgi:hypothetical protein